jgi:hypothetical protein
MSKKHSYEYVKNFFKEQGCELLSQEYKNNYEKLIYRCSCGDISYISFCDFKRGKRCKSCGIKKRADLQRHSYKYVKKFFKDNGCKLLSKKYFNANAMLKYKCSCGNISYITFSSFKAGCRCKICGIKKNANLQKHSYEYIKKYFEKFGYKLFDKKYINNKTKIKFKCPNGHISKITFNKFSNGNRCDI